MLYKNFKVNELDLFLLPMKLEDLNRFKEIRDQCLEFIHDNKSYTYSETVKWFLGENIRYLSLYTKDKMIGYVRLETTTIGCFIGMDLDPEFRGKSIAFTTYNQVIEELNKYGITIFSLRVLQNNQHAVKLYKALGFEISSSTEGIVIRDGKSIGDFFMTRKENKKIPVNEKIKPKVGEIITHLKSKNDKSS